MTYERPEDYERELARDRAEIGETIEAIQHRLSPGQLLDQALGYVKTSGSEAAGSVLRSAKQNPWPLILTGVGLAWLMQSTAASGRRGDGRAAGYGSDYGDYAGDQAEWTAEYARHTSALERAQSAVDSIRREAGEPEEGFQARLIEARARAMELTRDAGETAEAFRDRVEAAMRRTQERIAELGARTEAAVTRGAEAVGAQARHAQARLREAGDRTMELYQSEPLIAGAVGVVAGALIGALLPSTAIEDQAFGRQGQRIRSRAREVAATAAERAEMAAAEGARAAAEAAETVARGSGPEAEARPVRH